MQGAIKVELVILFLLQQQQQQKENAVYILGAGSVSRQASLRINGKSCRSAGLGLNAAQVPSGK